MGGSTERAAGTHGPGRVAAAIGAAEADRISASRPGGCRPSRAVRPSTLGPRGACYGRLPSFKHGLRVPTTLRDMTLLDTPTIPQTTPTERSARLTEAGTAWSDRIAADRENARLTYRVSGTGTGAVATRVNAGKHRFHVDEPAALAGDDAAPSPVEVALGALIACQVVVYRLYAQTLDIQFDDITITSEGDLDAQGLFGLDDSVRPGFSDIRLDIAITGAESEARYQQLKEAVDAACPVLDLFANPTPVSATVRKG